MSAANRSLNPGRNSSRSFSVGSGSGSMILRHHFPNRVTARIRMFGTEKVDGATVRWRRDFNTVD